MARRWAVSVAAAPLLGAGPPPRERVVTLGGTEPIVVNGVATDLRVDPGAAGLLLVTPAVAAAARLKGGGLLGFGVAYRVGTETVAGRTAVARVAMDGSRRSAASAGPRGPMSRASTRRSVRRDWTRR